MKFIEIPAAWAADMEGYILNPNIFHSATTLDGRTVIDPNAMEDFPDHFTELLQTGWHPVEESLSSEDFPLRSTD